MPTMAKCNAGYSGKSKLLPLPPPNLRFDGFVC